MPLFSTSVFLRHAAYCDIIARMAEANADEYILQGYRDAGGTPDAFQSVRFGSAAPMVFMVRELSYMFVFLRGIETYQHGLFFVEGGLIPQMVFPVPAVNAYIKARSDIITQAMNAFLHPAISILRIAGHSLGGAIACNLADDWFPSGIEWPNEVVTFGSPKPGNRAFASKANLKNLTRWIVPDDPIPAALPHIGDAPFAQQLLGPVISIIMDQNAQPPGGVLLAYMGTTIPFDGEHPMGGIYETDLGAWFNSNAIGGSNPHHIQTYGTSLMEHLSPANTAGGLKSEAILDEGVPPLSTIDAMIAIEQGVEVLSEGHVGGPPVSVILDRNSLPRVIRMGGQHAVRWKGFIVSVHKDRKTAQVEVKHLIAALRRLQLSQEWSISGLPNALAAYLIDASNPTGGFRPIPEAI